MPNTLVLIADGSEEMEAIITIDVLRRAGWDVTIAAVKQTPLITASRGVQVHADVCLEQINASLYELVVLPGGKGGTDIFAASDKVRELLQEYDAAGKPIAAICAAPLALDKAGILRKRHYTCYPGIEKEITNGQRRNDTVVEDENLITSQGPGTAFFFALALVARFENKKAAEKLRRQMIL